MAEKKISELTAITSAELDNDDNFLMVDTSESQTKKISKSELASALASGGDASTLEGQDGAYYLNYNNHTNTPTIPTNNNQLTNGAGYITASSTDTLTNKSGDISQFTNDSGYVTNTITGSLHVDSDGTDGVGSGLRVADVDFYDFGSGDPSFRNTNVNTRTVLRVLPNGTGMATAASAFEFFGKDYHTDSTTYHNFRIQGYENSDYIIDTSFGSAATPDKSIKFNLGLKGGNYNSGAENVLVLSGASATLGNVGIGTDTPSTKLEVAGDLTLTSTDAGATENPTLDLYRNSASPADNDVLGHIDFSGENSAGEKIVYAQINTDTADVTDGTEDGRMDISVMSGGSESQRVIFQGNGVTRFVNRDVEIGTGLSLRFEGSTDDGNELTLTSADPTSPRTITLPDATGTTVLTSLSDADASRGIIAVAAGRFNADGTTVNASNLSCSRTATGNYTLTFGSARPDSNYIVTGQIIESTSTKDDVKIHVEEGSQTTTAFNVNIYEGDNSTTADTDINRAFYIVIHDF